MLFKGQDIREELMSQLNNLPKKLDEIFGDISQLSLIRDYYKTFLTFTLKK
jgi:hypothetical protein